MNKKTPENKLASVLEAAAQKMKNGGKLTDEEWAEISEEFTIFRCDVNSSIDELRESKAEIVQKIRDLGYRGPLPE